MNLRDIACPKLTDLRDAPVSRGDLVLPKEGISLNGSVVLGVFDKFSEEADFLFGVSKVIKLMPPVYGRDYDNDILRPNIYAFSCRQVYMPRFSKKGICVGKEQIARELVALRKSRMDFYIPMLDNLADYNLEMRDNLF